MRSVDNRWLWGKRKVCQRHLCGLSVDGAETRALGEILLRLRGPLQSTRLCASWEQQHNDAKKESLSLFFSLSLSLSLSHSFKTAKGWNKPAVCSAGKGQALTPASFCQISEALAFNLCCHLGFQTVCVCVSVCVCVCVCV